MAGFVSLLVAAVNGEHTGRSRSCHRFTIRVSRTPCAIVREVGDIPAEGSTLGRREADALGSAERIVRLLAAGADLSPSLAGGKGADTVRTGSIAAVLVPRAGGPILEALTDALDTIGKATFEIIRASRAVVETLANALDAVAEATVEVVVTDLAVVEALTNALDAIAEAAVEVFFTRFAVVETLADAIKAATKAAVSIVATRRAIVEAATAPLIAIPLAALPAVAARFAEGDTGAVPHPVLQGRVARAALAAALAAPSRLAAAALTVRQARFRGNNARRGGPRRQERREQRPERRAPCQPGRTANDCVETGAIHLVTPR